MILGHIYLAVNLADSTASVPGVEYQLCLCVYYNVEYLTADSASWFHSSATLQALFTNINTLRIMQHGILKLPFNVLS